MSIVQAFANVRAAMEDMGYCLGDAQREMDFVAQLFKLSLLPDDQRQRLADCIA